MKQNTQVVLKNKLNLTVNIVTHQIERKQFKEKSKRVQEKTPVGVEFSGISRKTLLVFVVLLSFGNY